MIDKSKQALMNRLKSRFNGITDKFNVHIYRGEYSKENASLILFSDFLRKAIEGISFILENSFDASNQYKNEQQIYLISHIYNSSLLYYSKMFRGGNGIKREKLILKESKLFNSEGNEKENQSLRTDRFYIEEFFKKNSNEFKSHHEILFQVNKSIVHIDKTDLTKCYTILIFDTKETQKYLGIDNNFEYFQLPNHSTLTKFLSLFKNIEEQLNNRIRENTEIIHKNIQRMSDYSQYYKDLIINEEEI